MVQSFQLKNKFLFSGATRTYRAGGARPSPGLGAEVEGGQTHPPSQKVTLRLLRLLALRSDPGKLSTFRHAF